MQRPGDANGRGDDRETAQREVAVLQYALPLTGVADIEIVHRRPRKPRKACAAEPKHHRVVVLPGQLELWQWRAARARAGGGPGLAARSYPNRIAINRLMRARGHAMSSLQAIVGKPQSWVVHIERGGERWVYRRRGQWIVSKTPLKV